MIYGSALGISKAVSLLMVPVFTRFLEPADYGRLDILQTLADLFSIVIGLGLADTLFRFSGAAKSEQERRRVAANIFGMALVVGVVSLILTQLAAPAIAAALPGGVTVIQTRLILGNLALGGIMLVSLSMLRMLDFAGWFFAGSVGWVVIQAALGVLLLSLGFGITGVLAAGLTGAMLLAVALIVWQLRHTGVRLEAGKCREFAAYGAPLIFVGISGFVLGSFDRWILADAVGAARMAEYTLAAKFGLITAVLIQPFDLWWLPRRFAVLGEPGGAERIAGTIGIGVTIVVIAAVCVATAGPILIGLLTPESYHGAIRYVPWMALIAALHSTTTMFNIGCYSGRTTTWPVVIDGVAAVVAATGYFLLIPRFGAHGAIAATVLALGLRLLATYWISQTVVRLPYPVFRLFLVALAGIGVITAMQMLSASGSLIAAGTAGIVGLALFAAALRLMPLPASLIRRALAPQGNDTSGHYD